MTQEVPPNARPVDEADVLVVGAGPAGCATATYLAQSGLDVLLLDRLDHLGRGDLHVGHPVGIDPDPHRVLAPEDVGVADAVDPLQDVGDVDLPVIVQEVGVVAAVGRDQVDA